MNIEFEPLEFMTGFVDDGSRGSAIRFPVEIKEPISYLLDAKEYIKDEKDIKRQIRLSKRLYRYEPIIGSVIDAQTEMCVTPLELQPTGVKELDEILLHFLSHINSGVNHIVSGIDELSLKMTNEHFQSGNVFPFEYWGFYDLNGKQYAAPKFIYLLDPESIIISPRQDIIGNEEIMYAKNSTTVTLVKGDGRINPNSAILKRAIKPSEIRKINDRIHSGDGFKLNTNYVTHLKRKAQDYETWGIPYLTRAFAPIAALHKLRRLDESTIEGLINLITIFKVGTEERPASTQRLQSFANLFKDPKTMMYLVWAHDLEIEKVGPDGQILNLKDAFSQKYEEIFAALNVPPVLLGLGAMKGKAGDSYNQMLILSSRLQVWRETLKKYYQGILRKIAVVNGHKDIEPKLFWQDLELNKDVYFKEFVLAMYDRGLVDPEIAIKKGGFDYISMVERFKKFKKDKIQEATGIGVPPQLPFSGGAAGTDNKAKPGLNRKKQDQIYVNKSKSAIMDSVSNSIDSMMLEPNDTIKFVSNMSASFKEISEISDSNYTEMLSRASAELYRNYQKNPSKKHKDSFLKILKEFLDQI